MSDDMLTALMAAIDRRAAEDTTSLDDARRARSARTPDQNNPWRAEYRRAPRETNPAKWSPPAYRDRDAERVVGRLSKKEKRKP